jgi:hypothetical protein
LAAGVLLTSGPRHTKGLSASVRAATWIFHDPQSIVYVRQSNPVALSPNDLIVRVLWVVWALWVLGVSTAIAARAVRRRRPSIAVVAIAGFVTVILAYPESVRPLAAGSVILGRWYSNLLLAVPVIAAAFVGAVAVWEELVRPRLSHSQAGALQLGSGTTPDALRRELVRALADPTVRVAFPSEMGWIDQHGRGMTVASDAHRAATVVTRNGHPLAAIDYDVSLLGQPDLVDVAATTTAWSLDARRLAALAEAAAEDIRRSAARLLAAGDEGRRHVERLIADGPDRRLSMVATLLGERPVDLGRVHDGLRAALTDVREIAHGATPPSLSDGGLALALADLRGVGVVPFEIDGVPSQRFPTGVEVTLYLAAADIVFRASGPVTAQLWCTYGEVHLRLDGGPESLEQLVLDRVETLGGRVETTNDALIVSIPSINE